MKLKTGLLRITRRYEYYAFMRGLVVRLDGEKVGSIAIGKSIELELYPAEYEVQVRMDWCSSKPFVFQLYESQILHLEAKVNGGAFGYLFHSPINLFLLTPITDNSKRKNDDLLAFL